MASPTCPKCNNHSFKLEQTVPNKFSYKLYFVQCSKCGTPVGIMECFNIDAKIEELQKNIEEKLNSLQSSDSAINNNKIIGQFDSKEPINPTKVPNDYKICEKALYQNGKIEIVFIDGIADWITVKELEDFLLTKILFSY